MEGKIYCLVVDGNLVDDDIRDMLLATAYQMAIGHQKKQRVKAEGCEGIVRTKFQRQSLVDIHGLVFMAELDTEKGRLAITYILRDQDLRALEEMEEGAWLSLEELGQPIAEERIRPSPIKRVKRAFQNN